MFLCLDWQQIKVHIVFCQIIISVITSVNASSHVCLTCPLLELLCDNSNCKGVITIKVNIYSLWTWLLHLHALRLWLSLADLGGVRPVRAPPFAWHPSFWWYFGTYCIGGSGGRTRRAPPHLPSIIGGSRGGTPPHLPGILVFDDILGHIV